jgi:hypothetical protein
LSLPNGAGGIMKRNVEKTPDSIVENGEIRFGVYKSPFDNMNLGEASLPGLPRNPALRRMRLKEWIGWGIHHPEWFFTVFFQDAKLLSSCLFTAHDLKTGKTYKYQRARPGGGIAISKNLIDGQSSFYGGGLCYEMHNHFAAGEHKIVFESNASRSKPYIKAEINLSEKPGEVQPLIASLPLRGGHSIFTHKAACPASGSVRIGDVAATLDPARDIGILDEHRSYLPYRTYWRWGTFAGRDSRGRIVAANLGNNAATEDQEQWNENCVWVGANISLIGAVDLEVDRNDMLKTWKICERNGRADLEFHPAGIKSEIVNLLAMRMWYKQAFGVFRGSVVDDSGEKHSVADYFGVAEIMDAHF